MTLYFALTTLAKTVLIVWYINVLDRLSSTYGHSQLKTGHPVRSAIHKQLNGRLVLRWVTTWESLLLYVLHSFYLSHRPANVLPGDDCGALFRFLAPKERSHGVVMLYTQVYLHAIMPILPPHDRSNLLIISCRNQTILKSKSH
jgi:hypothetical protein